MPTRAADGDGGADAAADGAGETAADGVADGAADATVEDCGVASTAIEGRADTAGVLDTDFSSAMLGRALATGVAPLIGALREARPAALLAAEKMSSEEVRGDIIDLVRAVRRLCDALLWRARATGGGGGAGRPGWSRRAEGGAE